MNKRRMKKAYRKWQEGKPLKHNETIALRRVARESMQMLGKSRAKMELIDTEIVRAWNMST